MDPKHVRDYFYKYALFTRVFTLWMDGTWWLVRGGWRYATKGLIQFIRAHWPLSMPVNERLRRQHSFIVGRTGTGKSVLLHQIVRHYLTKNQRPSVVLLDPHGDLGSAVARDKELLQSNRLVYLDFNGLHGRQVQLNPFNLTRASETHLNRAQLQFAAAVEQIIGEAFTPRQRTLIRACFAVMLHAPDMTMLDLLRLLQDGQNADLVRYGQTQLPNSVDRMFFRHSFADPHYAATKLALVSRLTDIVRDPVVRRFTCGGNSFDLAKVLDSGHVLVVKFDPATQGRDTIRTIGQLLTAAIASHVLGRSSRARHPIHLFIDEAQFFCSPAIAEVLGESRKFGLYLTLATQRLDNLDNLDNALQDAILGNVGNLWVGGSRHHTAERIAKETDIAPDTIRQLRNLQFLHAVNGRTAQQHRLRYIGDRYAISQNQWTDTKRTQATKYYCAPLRSDEVQPANFIAQQRETDWIPTSLNPSQK